MGRELKGCDEAPSAGIGITITEAARLGGDLRFGFADALAASISGSIDPKLS